MKKLIIIALAVVAFAGCYNDSYDKLYPTPVTNTNTNTCDTTTVSYTTDILPILSQNCSTGSSCHVAGGASGYDLTDTTVLKTEALNGAIVGDINYAPTGRNHNMPLTGGKLSDCNINKITRWVNLGALCSH